MKSTVKLLIVIPDSLSTLIQKGEITTRYYNPGNLFDEVHILMTNDDRPDLAALQKTVGTAKLYLHNLPLPSFVKTLGRLPLLMKTWAQAGVNLARQIQPALIRAHGNYYNGFLAAQIKKQLGIPLVVSLHTHLDVDGRATMPWLSQPKSRLVYELMRPHERITLQAADWVLPVYEAIGDYAAQRGAKRIKICYNVLNTGHLRKKESYQLHQPPRIISVGRQFKEKNPENIIRAVANLEAELTIVGDGAYHDYLQQVAYKCGVANRVTFYRALPNDELCQMLPDYDIFAVHVQSWGIAKAVLEPMLTGMPIVHNRRQGEAVAELQGDQVMLVENSVDGYYSALQYLLTNHSARETLGRKAYAYAQQYFNPAKTEQAYVDIYKSLIGNWS